MKITTVIVNGARLPLDPPLELNEGDTVAVSLDADGKPTVTITPDGSPVFEVEENDTQRGWCVKCGWTDAEVVEIRSNDGPRAGVTAVCLPCLRSCRFILGQVVTDKDVERQPWLDRRQQ